MSLPEAEEMFPFFNRHTDTCVPTTLSELKITHYFNCLMPSRHAHRPVHAWPCLARLGLAWPGLAWRCVPVMAIQLQASGTEPCLARLGVRARCDSDAVLTDLPGQACLAWLGVHDGSGLCLVPSFLSCKHVICNMFIVCSMYMYLYNGLMQSVYYF